MKRLVQLLFCVAMLVLTSAAQTKSTGGKVASEATRLAALKVVGTSRYTDKEILGATGLQIGQNAADGDFKEAAQRLGDSGLFSDVAYSYSFSGTAVRLELTVSDTEPSKLVPASFENFVWFTDGELRSAIQQRVPLFKQLVPLTGNLSDRISEALQSILSERKLPGQVTFLREGDESGGALHAINYRVEGVSVKIHGMEFPGATAEFATLLTAAARRAMGSEYSHSALTAVAQYDLLPVYLQRGYLKAAFGSPTAHLVAESESETDVQGQPIVPVDAIVPVTPGNVFLTAGVDWKGNSAIATAELAPLLHLPNGQPTDAVRLVRDIGKVGKLYRSRGYMTSQITTANHLDEEKNFVHYDINVVEGDVYNMGELEILGLDTQARSRLTAAWKLRQGQPYNADYLAQFLQDTDQLLPRGVHWKAVTHATPDAKDKTVDVEIRFQQ